VKRSMVYSKRARARRPTPACQATWWLAPQAERTHAQQRVRRACLVEGDLLRREQPYLYIRLLFVWAQSCTNCSRLLRLRSASCVRHHASIHALYNAVYACHALLKLQEPRILTVCTCTNRGMKGCVAKCPLSVSAKFLPAPRLCAIESSSGAALTFKRMIGNDRLISCHSVSAAYPYHDQRSHTAAATQLLCYHALVGARGSANYRRPRPTGCLNCF